jgi:hypothetical protein
MEYFDGTVFPKFILYSAHAETVYPLLAAFEHFLATEAPPASAIFLDFFTVNGEDKVRILFKQNPED